MDIQVHKAKTILQVYLKRGKRALEKIGEGDLDSALSLCLWRGAAFHNFRVVDKDLLKKGIDLAADLEVKALWQDLDEVNALLDQRLGHALDQTKQEIGRTREYHQQISKYHSGVTQQNYVIRA